MRARLAMIGALALLAAVPGASRVVAEERPAEARPAGERPAGERPAQPQWAPSIAAGLAAAKERGVAFMVALNMDRERGNQKMVDEVYTSSEFAAAAGKCVVAIASMYEHELVRGLGGTKVCARFGSVTCAQHRVIEDMVRRDWLGRGPKDDVESPRHFFLSPGGKILFERVWTISAKDLAALMARASELCTPERLAAWDTLAGRLDRAFDSIAAVRDIALADLITENDADIDAALAARAKQEPDAGVVGSVFAAFARAADGARRGLARNALAHKVPEVRMRVAYAMGESGHADHLKPLLARVGKEKEPRPRASMLRAISKLGPDDAGVRKALVRALSTKDDLVREQACVALAPFAREKGVRTALQRLLVQGGSRDIRAAASWCLGLSDDKNVKRFLVGFAESLPRRERRLERAVQVAIDRLEGRGEDGYEGLAARYFPDPAVGDKPADLWGKRGDR